MTTKMSFKCWTTSLTTLNLRFLFCQNYDLRKKHFQIKSQKMVSLTSKISYIGRYVIQHNDNQYNDIQHKSLICDKQHKWMTFSINYTQHNNNSVSNFVSSAIMLFWRVSRFIYCYTECNNVVILKVVMLSVVMLTAVAPYWEILEQIYALFCKPDHFSAMAKIVYINETVYFSKKSE
jgi:hypothetical protein